MVTVVSSVCTLLGVIVTVAFGNSKTLYRIEQLERKVDKHNSVLERVYKLEQRIDDIEGGGNG